MHFHSSLGLPVELWMDIFLASVQQQLRSDAYSSASCAFAPLVFTRVCSLWRAIAFADARLWRTLVLRHAGKSTTPAVIERWAERSQPYALSVRIRSDDSVWFVGDGMIPHSSLDHFASADAGSFLQRVERLDTVIPGYASERIFGRTPAASLSLTELRLDLRTWSLFHRKNLARLLDFLQPAPRLRHLSLNYPAFALMPVPFPQNSHFPFAQLTVLELLAPTGATALVNVLCSCPSLEELLLPAFFPHLYEGSWAGGSGRDIFLPRLRRLAFASPKDSESLINQRCFEFFSASTLPALTSLAFPERCSDAASLKAGFSMHSRCALTKVEVAHVQHPADVLAFLAKHETIERLSLPYLAQASVLQALYGHPKSGAHLLPRLRSLRLVLPASTGLLADILDTIPGLLDARNRAGGAGVDGLARLDRVEVVVKTEQRKQRVFDDAILEPLRRRVLAEEGRLILAVKN
ncbi:F-box domain-containing protein [Mycena kentingensis (nom. inval.)]|nr:F-box domain-containing protein [Mycena kentingensis (nom. inval.)]